jgi:dTDP-4-dehydrorhamnose reductase
MMLITFGVKILDNMKNMKIYVLGTSGMLGKYVSTYFRTSGFYVVDINRDKLDASNITQEELHAKLFHLGLKKDDVIINCMGTIKPRIDALGDLNGILVNSVFPRMLANVSEVIGAHLIHPTTDCVYSGLKGSYNEDDKYDVSDVYGMSKALGEPSNCTVVRTSIIGEEVGQGRSLVEWIKSSAGQTVNGFTNHHWNGVTCLQFAKICEQIITTNDYWMGIKHLHSNVLDKQQLVETVSKVYKLNVTVLPKETPVKCDRSMCTIYAENLAKFNIPTLEEQIRQMKEFSNTLYA